MAQPILVVDFGSWATSAAVVLGERTGLVREPVTRALRWPSAACLDGGDLLVGTAAVHRRDQLVRCYAEGIRNAAEDGGTLLLGDRAVTGTGLLVTYLAVVRAETERAYGTRIERLTLTVPASYGGHGARRELMLSVAAAAGFPDAELVSDAVAAAADPAADLRLPDEALVLVCDLGATWTVAVVSVHGEQAVTVAQETSTAGTELDSMLVEDLRARLADWTEPAIAAGGDVGTRARYQAADFVRELKHRLADAPEAAGQLIPAAPAYRLTRAELERYAQPALRWLLASCRAVVAQAGATLADIAAVTLVGGGARLAAAGTVLGSGLGCPVRQSADPELAVIRGAVRWASGVRRRQVTATPPTWRVEPLVWEVPDGRARLVRWLAEPGRHYCAGAALAQVRTADDRIYDLTAGRDGILLEHRVVAGEIVGSGAVAAMARSVSVIEGDRPTRCHQLRVAGEWLLTPDRQLLVECADTGAYVRLRTIANGAVLSELRPAAQGVQPRHGRVFCSPAGRPALIAWDVGGEFFVWDVPSGTLTATFRDAAAPLAVRVNEADWRLLAETDRKVQVGRYRRDVATLWDLRTGTRLQELVGEDLHRHYQGYADRSADDGFATETHSPDGRLRAAAVHGADGGTAICLHDAHTEQEVFRTDSAPVPSVRAAFSADGHHLLATWKSGGASCLDVWRI